ncbi:hypothetical protein C3L33_03269, partial [Rhododendron williamsianum]
MLMIEPTTAVRLSFDPTASRRLSHSGSFSVAWNKFQRSADASHARSCNYGKNRKIRASAEEPGPSRYHPFEEVAEPELIEGFLGDDVHENIFWPDLPYVTDEHANIYFQVKNDEDILQTLTAEDNYVEWVSDLEDDEDEEDDESLGDWAKLDTMRTSHPMYFAKRLAEVVTDDPVDCMDQPPDGLSIQGLLRPALIEEHSVIQKHISDHNSGTSDLKQTEIHDEDKVENLGIINDHRQLSQDSSTSAEELEKGESLGKGTSFYKLEMIKIELISHKDNRLLEVDTLWLKGIAYRYSAVIGERGRGKSVEVQDLRKAKPDAIAHSAANIISRLKAGGEKTTQALKSLCWRCKGIQVEEASIIGVDTLGFDLRISSGTQIQTLRFTFNARASSEYSAERQLNDLLFPRTHHNPQKKREASQTEL